jgi:hypothetical protein
LPTHSGLADDIEAESEDGSLFICSVIVVCPVQPVLLFLTVSVPVYVPADVAAGIFTLIGLEGNEVKEPTLVGPAGDQVSVY